MGGRRNRSLVDAAMLKLLTFECARIKKATIADTMYDLLVACFDRMKARMSNIIAQRSKVDKNILRARAIVIENLSDQSRQEWECPKLHMGKNQANLRSMAKYTREGRCPTTVGYDK